MGKTRKNRGRKSIKTMANQFPPEEEEWSEINASFREQGPNIFVKADRLISQRCIIQSCIVSI